MRRSRPNSSSPMLATRPNAARNVIAKSIIAAASYPNPHDAAYDEGADRGRYYGTVEHLQPERIPPQKACFFGVQQVHQNAQTERQCRQDVDRKSTRLNSSHLGIS